MYVIAKLENKDKQKKKAIILINRKSKHNETKVFKK